MVDINQWRASIGGWSCRCTSISWSVSNNKVKTNPTITDSVSILAGPATLSLVLVLVLLLVLSGDIELNPGPGLKPDAFDVFHFLKSHSSRWDEIGRDLKIDLNTRRKIEQGGSPERKLEEVIDYWIQSCCSEVTWDNLIEVLQDLQMVSTAKEIENCLLNDEKMKKKYNWKRVCPLVDNNTCISSELAETQTNQLHVTRNSPVAMAVRQGNAITAAKKLKKDFNELLDFSIPEISANKNVTVEQLCYRINYYFKEEEEAIDEKIDKHLKIIEDYNKHSAILNHFVRHGFIGYINYSLLKIFQQRKESIIGQTY